MTGATGLLGTEVVREARRRGWPVSGSGRTGFDVTDADAVRARVEAERPDVVVHCAAHASVDAAEGEPDLAFAVNRDGAAHVARASARVGARLVHVSTDYVFDGSKDSPYVPEDPTGPLSVYGRSKLAGERAVLQASDDALVVRTSWVYGTARPCFVTNMIAMAERGEAPAVVDDQWGGPTSAPSAASTLLDLALAGATGVWHAADRGACTPAELADEAIRLRGLDVRVARVSSEGRAAAAPRPRWSALDVAATEALLGRAMPCWKDALAAFVAALPPAGASKAGGTA